MQLSSKKPNNDLKEFDNSTFERHITSYELDKSKLKYDNSKDEIHRQSYMNTDQLETVRNKKRVFDSKLESGHISSDSRDFYSVIKKTRKIETQDSSNCLDSNSPLKKTRSHVEHYDNYLLFDDKKKYSCIDIKQSTQINNESKLNKHYNEKDSSENPQISNTRNPHGNFNENLNKVNKIFLNSNKSNFLNHNDKSRDFSGYSENRPEGNFNENLNTVNKIF